MLSRNDLSPAIKSLLSRGFVDLPNNSSTEFLCSNAYFYLRSFFTDRAGKVLHNRIDNCIHQRWEVFGHIGLMRFIETLGIKSAKNKYGSTRVLDMVNFMGFCATEENLDLAFANLINIINDLAERDYIIGAMLPLSIMELARLRLDEPRKFCVITYIAIKSGKSQQWVDANLSHVTFKEGCVPTEVNSQ